ncbi:MAG: hypothetical protein ACXWWC_04390 [Chitinophagaceae bacterium]
MHHMLFILLTICSFLYSQPGISQPASNSSVNLMGVFDGRTPCRDLAKQINETVTTECIKIKWRLTLYKNAELVNQGNYELIGFIYKKDNPRIGKWHIVKGAHSNPDAIVYQLDQDGREPLLLMKGDDNILFFLDQEKKLMVGNRDFSYTLNRVAKKF